MYVSPKITAIFDCGCNLCMQVNSLYRTISLYITQRCFDSFVVSHINNVLFTLNTWIHTVHR